jgi:hypothetical protein
VTGGGSPVAACGPATGVYWCDGADVPGAFFTEACADFARWDD